MNKTSIPKLHSYKLKSHIRVDQYHDRKKEISDEVFLKEALIDTLYECGTGMSKASVIGVLEQIKIHVHDN